MRQRLAAVGEMAAGIAHEIRNPLASMSGAMQVLRGELALSAEQATLMDIVLRESDRLNSTISSFLAYARPGPGRGDADRRPARGAGHRGAAAKSPETADDHVIDVEVPTDPVWLDADEHQLRQIVWNLATNGLKAMPRRRPSADVRRRPRTARCRSACATRAPASRPRRSTPSSTRSAARSAAAPGSGLAIVHRIVTDYNGRIDVQSAVGRGTTIVVKFPAPRVRRRRAGATEETDRTMAAVPAARSRASWSSTTSGRCARCCRSCSAARATR